MRYIKRLQRFLNTETDNKKPRPESRGFCLHSVYLTAECVSLIRWSSSWEEPP
jgi:hypothetical protein